MKNTKQSIDNSLLDILKIYMCREIMLDEKSVEFMSIVGLGPGNTKAWEEFYNSAESVLERLLEGKDAEIRLENYLASISKDFTQKDFAKVLRIYNGKEPQEDDGFIYAPDVKWD